MVEAMTWHGVISAVFLRHYWKKEYAKKKKVSFLGSKIKQCGKSVVQVVDLVVQ